MMIARNNETPGREFLLIGLSKENIARLQEGKPIQIQRSTHGDGVPDGWTIAIMYGETELAMHDALKGAGVLRPDTKINIDPRLK